MIETVDHFHCWLCRKRFVSMKFSEDIWRRGNFFFLLPTKKEEHIYFLFIFLKNLSHVFTDCSLSWFLSALFYFTLVFFKICMPPISPSGDSVINFYLKKKHRQASQSVLERQNRIFQKHVAPLIIFFGPRCVKILLVSSWMAGK